ncbi:LuxR family transcriptional regulator [Sulfuricella denitrificans skB26]|uniref:LuxR family transcriptional regulator n=1 Tax=Sulfuricella denitrificans (strain DSM 22764 / NBRC 105220 / skB26) TaxID=1163617 RepID=S6AEI4_SULDS|nr:response regulator transcription factor [Sulfuricella denitrificans]BAN34186.1 LuxR family transcriptional regulator [Sulfuricella denitrificans skB26]
MPSPIRILLADDHPLFREGVAHSLGAEPDFEVIAQAGSGEEAVELANRLHPNMVLLDVTMTGMGGIVAAGKIATSLLGVRIMMLTVSENRENLMAALKAGAHGYVLKGVSASELRAITRRVANGEAYVTPALAADMLTEFSRPLPLASHSELTERETKILKLLSQGLTNREIGEAMCLAEKTVKHYMTSILQKLHVRSRTEAALIAMRHGVSGCGP